MPVLTGAPGPTSGVVMLALTDWWLKDPLDPTRNRAVQVRRAWSPVRKVVAGTFYPRGRSTAVVASGEVYGIAAPLGFRTLTRAAFVAAEVLVFSKRTLLLQNVVGQQWYVRVNGDVSQPMLLAAPDPDEDTPVRHAHDWTVPLVEVAAP